MFEKGLHRIGMCLGLTQPYSMLPSQDELAHSRDVASNLQNAGTVYRASIEENNE